MTQIRSNILILGIGNYLMGDEGLGVHFIQFIEKKLEFKKIALLDGGTGGIHLMNHLESFQKVIIIDAIMDGKEAGTIRLLKPKFPKEFPISLSSHDIGLKELINGLTLLDRLPEIFLFAISISNINAFSISLSESIRSKFDILSVQIMDLILSFED